MKHVGRCHIHSLVDLVDAHSTVDLRHRCTSLLHRLQGLVVDISRFDGIDLLLELNDLRCCLLEVLFVNLFPSEGGFGSCTKYKRVRPSIPILLIRRPNTAWL